LREIFYLAAPRNTYQAETIHLWGMWEMIMFYWKPSTAPEAGHWRETLQKQSLTCKELQVLCVKEALYLQGGWEGLLDQLRISPTISHLRCEEVEEQY